MTPKEQFEAISEQGALLRQQATQATEEEYQQIASEYQALRKAASALLQEHAAPAPWGGSVFNEEPREKASHNT